MLRDSIHDIQIATKAKVSCGKKGNIKQKKNKNVLLITVQFSYNF